MTMQARLIQFGAKKSTGNRQPGQVKVEQGVNTDKALIALQDRPVSLAPEPEIYLAGEKDPAQQRALHMIRVLAPICPYTLSKLMATGKIRVYKDINPVEETTAKETKGTTVCRSVLNAIKIVFRLYFPDKPKEYRLSAEAYSPMGPPT